MAKDIKILDDVKETCNDCSNFTHSQSSSLGVCKAKKTKMNKFSRRCIDGDFKKR